ncbi:hypothetical protein CPB84DRAFT_205708 [Gymnopilus junonius]|uniref:Uncharacterized protein n=1 Tax=Gymnopilus junonius TaxID=109634 RepID=A0A9P5TQW0_GYMJU|nr:hypothetical protein CPB84DRAFT_205708 [Gymnopilus junonius]
MSYVSLSGFLISAMAWTVKGIGTRIAVDQENLTVEVKATNQAQRLRHHCLRWLRPPRERGALAMRDSFPATQVLRAVVEAQGQMKIKYREQGVDELLQLKLHQALAATDDVPEGSTIVLATGDGNMGQFNEEGFLGPVRTALRRGWKVELYAWEDGLSEFWIDIKASRKSVDNPLHRQVALGDVNLG